MRNYIITIIIIIIVRYQQTIKLNKINLNQVTIFVISLATKFRGKQASKNKFKFVHQQMYESFNFLFFCLLRT